MSRKEAKAQRCTCPSGDGSLRWPCPTHPPEAQGGGEVAAWETEDGLVISARQKAVALRDGGASASSVAPYTTPLYRTAPPSAPVGVEELLAAWEADIAAARPWAKRDLSLARAVRDLRALAQQPAAVDGDVIVIDGRCYAVETVRTTLLGLAADVARDLAAQPGGSDNG